MSLTLEVTQTVLRAVEETTPLDVVIETRPVTVEVNAGTPLSDDIAAALNAAHAPSATNPFATLDDMDAVYPLAVPVTRDWSDADQAYLDIIEGLRITLQQPISRSLLISVFFNAAGHTSLSDHAVIRVSTTPPNVTYDYLVPFNDVSAIGQEAFVSSITSLLPLTESDMTDHVAAADPHGDRAYTDDLLLGHAMNHTAHGPLTDSDLPASITRDTELQAAMLAEVNARTGAIAAAIQGHVSEVDPHGDRAYVDAQRYSRLFMLGA